MTGQQESWCQILSCALATPACLQPSFGAMRLSPTCEGKSTPCWPQMAEHRAASGDAPCVRALKMAGAMMIGKASCHEAGAGMTGMSLAHGTARNPHDPTRVAGGSSGGSAALVAAGICPFAIGRSAHDVMRLLPCKLRCCMAASRDSEVTEFSMCSCCCCALPLYCTSLIPSEVEFTASTAPHRAQLGH